jgi:phage recombination protein Bet
MNNTTKDLAPVPAQNAAPAKRVSVIGKLAAQLNIDPATLLGVLKKSVFAACKTDEEFQMACMTAAKYGLDPVQKEIYAFPAKNGAVVPVVGVDGWNKIMNTHPQFDGIEFDEGDGYCTAIIYRKDRAHPTKVTEWLSECERTTEPWKRWPRRMLRHKAMIQAARIAFGFSGIKDEDEAQRMDEVTAPPAPTAKPSKLRDALGIPPETPIEEATFAPGGEPAHEKAPSAPQNAQEGASRPVDEEIPGLDD